MGSRRAPHVPGWAAGVHLLLEHADNRCASHHNPARRKISRKPGERVEFGGEELREKGGRGVRKRDEMEMGCTV